MSTTTLSSSFSSSVSSAFPSGSQNGIPPHLLEYQTRGRESINAVLSLLTPLNTLLLALTVYALYRALSPATPITIPNAPPAIVFRTFTPRTLLPFNGKLSPSNPNSSVYLAVKGKVYDVSSGRNFYGPGGPYENFAGRDATRGLACQSFDDEMLTKNLDGPLDGCKDLNKDQLENLQGWVERFDDKYLVVGKLVAFRETEFH